MKKEMTYNSKQTTNGETFSVASGGITTVSVEKQIKSASLDAITSKTGGLKKQCSVCGKYTAFDNLFTRELKRIKGSFEISLCPNCVDTLIDDLIAFRVEHVCEQCKGRGFITQTGENYQHAVPCPLCKAREANY